MENKKLRPRYKAVADKFTEDFKIERKKHKKLTNRKIANEINVNEAVVSLYVNGHFKAIELYLREQKFNIPA